MRAKAADEAKEYGKSPVLVIRSKLVSSGGLNGVHPLRDGNLRRVMQGTRSASQQMMRARGA